VAAIEVDHSVPTGRAVAGALLAGYELGDLRACDLLSHGINDLYLVVAGAGRFVRRVGPASDPVAARSPAGLAYELDLLGHLVAGGFPCPEPVARRDGRASFVLDAPEGPRPAVLFRHVPGELVDASELVPEQATRYGGVVAWFHDLSDGLRSPHAPPLLDLDRLVDRPLAVAAPALADRPDDLRFLRALAADVRRCLDDLGPGDVGPCHGDLTGGNAHQDGSSLALIDFEWCGTGRRAYDLAVFRWRSLLARRLAG
jgi:Ser/Thr protein kinase RdoA (MazF antagonist)